MVKWFLSKLTIHKFSTSADKKSSTSNAYIEPFEGETDQAYLLRLIMSGSDKRKTS